MQEQILPEVAIRVTRNDVPLENALVGVEGEKLASNSDGVAQFRYVDTGIYDITVQHEGKLYIVRAVLVSDTLEVSLTGKEPVKEIPPARQEAYVVAAQTAPQFIGFLAIIGIALVLAFIWIDANYKKMKSGLKILLRLAIFVTVVVGAVFLYTAASGTSSILFAMILPQTSARAGEDALKPPRSVSVERVAGGNIEVRWRAPIAEQREIVGYEIVLIKKGDNKAARMFFTNATDISFAPPQRNAEYVVEIRTVSGIIDPIFSIPIRGEVE